MNKFAGAAFALFLAHLPVTADDTPPARSKGKLIAVGGGTIDDEMAKRIIETAGGPDAKILIIPCASERPEAGEESAKAWRERGAKQVNWLACSAETSKPLLETIRMEDTPNHFEGAIPLIQTTPSEANPSYSPHAESAIRSASFIWLSGGDQNRLMKMLNEFKLADVIRERHAAGATVGGTSAGAAALSKTMLTGQSKLDRIAVEPGDIAEGLGLWPDVVVDQHFLARGRFNRLLAVVMENHQLVGIGVDESTAVIVDGSKFEVIGQGQVLAIDARHFGEKQTPPHKPDQPMYGIRLHYLPHGSKLDLSDQSP